MRLPLVLAAAALLALPADAQIALGDDATLSFSGGIQPRVSFASQAVGAESRTDTRLGFGLRRARLQLNLKVFDRFGVEYDLDAAPGDVRSVDLFGYVDVSETVRVRAGRLPPTQPQAYVPTSNTRIDAVDRAVIAERWASGTIGSSGRDFGAEVEIAAGATEVELSVFNGGGGFGRSTDNFRESGSAGSLTRGTDLTELALGATVHHEAGAGVAVGGFASASAAGSDETVVETPSGEVRRGYATAGAHLYWGERPGSQPVRVKLDALGIRYEAVGGDAQRAAGASAFGAVRVFGFGEAFARAERYWDDLDGDPLTVGTVGLSYSPSAARGGDYRDVRVTAGYTIREDAAGDVGHLVVVQGQIVF